MKHWKRRLTVGVLTGAVLTGGLAWRATPRASLAADQTIESARPSQDGSAVRRLESGAQTPPGRKGSTYYALEGRTIRVTSRYDDGIVVVAERGNDGALHARAADASGNELARLQVADSVRYAPANGEALQAEIHESVRPTLEWANRQAYGLVKDGTANLAWRGQLMRAGRTDLRPRVVETEWPGGLVVKGTRRENVKDPSADGRVFTGQAQSASLTRDGVEIGLADWYPRSQVFRWTIPTLRVGGSIEAKHLERYKGWPFTPDAEWLNLQLLAFYHFKTLIDEKGFVAKSGGGKAPFTAVSACGAAPPSLAGRLLNVVAPAARANEAGCDGLHWLDGSIYRYCCDVHDFCYEKYGCNSRSWWQFWSSWRCTGCNTWAAWCFATGRCIFLGGLGCTIPAV